VAAVPLGVAQAVFVLDGSREALSANGFTPS